MPLTACTAVEIDTLPDVLTESAPASPGYLWFKRTAGVGETSIGLYATATGGYNPAITVWTGPTCSSLTQVLPSSFFGSFSPPAPIVVPMTPGHTYYFRVEDFDVTGTPATVTLDVVGQPDEVIPAGSLIVNDDTEGHGAVVISQDGDEVLRYLYPFPAGEGGDVLPTGEMLLDQTDSSVNEILKLYDHNFDLIADVTSPSATVQNHVIRRYGTSLTQFIVGNAAAVFLVDNAGVVGTQWTFPSSAFSLGANPDGTIAYFVNNATANQAVKRQSLAGAGSPLSNLAAGVANYNTPFDGLMVLSDGTILVAYVKPTVTRDSYIIRYSEAGAVLNTYNFANTYGPVNRIARTLDDPDTFWVWRRYNSGGVEYSRFTLVDVATGAHLTDFTQAQFNQGVGPNTGSPLARYGHSFSCPFFALMVAPGGSPEEGGIIGPLVWMEFRRSAQTAEAEEPPTEDTPTPPSPSPTPPPSPPIPPGSPEPPDVGGTYGPVPEAAPGGSYVEIAAGANIQDVIDDNAAGTTYYLRAGYYRNQTITPKNNDSIIGEYGATLTGSRILSAWTYEASGNRYYATGQEQEGAQHGECRTGYPRCNRPEDVFLNHVPLRAVASLSALASGTFYFDYTANRIYIKDDPAGLLVETSITATAITGSASGVTIRNLLVEKYATAAQSGAIHPSGGSGWTIYRVEGRLNHGMALKVKAGMTVERCRWYRNGQMGFGGSECDGAEIIESEVAYNNYAGYSDGWEAGGCKIAETDGITFQSNWFHHNDGPGLWCDINNINVLIEGNLCEYNNGNGIYHEISYAAVIRYNTCRYNGTAYTGNTFTTWYGILVSASPDVEIYGNTCAYNGGQIGGMQQNRGTGTYGPWEIENMNVHDNRCIATSAQLMCALFQDTGDTTYYTSRNNHFENNIYEGGVCGSALWFWQPGLRTFAQWQAHGNDDSGSAGCS